MKVHVLGNDYGSYLRGDEENVEKNVPYLVIIASVVIAAIVMMGTSSRRG
jgi:hypothetical protein